MTPEEAIAFDRLAARAAFAQWCAELSELVGEERASTLAVELLNQWLADGALAGFALGTPSPPPLSREAGEGSSSSFPLSKP
jgi:hypothetical protein